MIKYATITVGRNEEKDIEKCLNLIINQSISASHIIIIDDGSSDQTPKIVKTFNQKNITFFIRKDRGFNALSSNSLYLLSDVYNTGLLYLRNKTDWDYLLVVPADCHIPKDYIEKIAEKIMGYGVYGVVSGSPVGHILFENYNKDHSTGGGMLIHRRVLNYLSLKLKNNRSIYGLYPRNNGYESCPIYSANFLGMKVGRFEDVIYYRPRISDSTGTTPHICWGKGMKDSNYHFLYFLGRVIREILIRHNINIGIRFFVGYFSQRSYNYPDYLIHLHQTQRIQIKSGMIKVLRKMRLY